MVSDGQHPIEPERLRVFATDDDIPTDQTNTTIDEQFVPVAQWQLPADEDFAKWQAERIAELRQFPFQTLPPEIPSAKRLSGEDQREEVETESGIRLALQHVDRDATTPADRILLVVRQQEESDGTPDWLDRVVRSGDAVTLCDVRGIGDTRWTERNPPNYVARAHVLLGQTVETGRVRDVAAIARYLREQSSTSDDRIPVHVVGRGSAAIIAAYAALFEPEIAGVTLFDPPSTHMDSQSPQFLSILRVGDVPELLGLLAPRPLTLVGADSDDFAPTAAAYAIAGAADQLSND